MRIRFALFVLILGSCGVALGQNVIYARLGGNVTSIRGQKIYLRPGVTMAIGRHHCFSDHSGWLGASGWAIELVWTNKRALLKDKAIGGGAGDVGFGDIYCSVALLEIPLLVTFDRALSDKIKLEMHFGIALSLAIDDRSRRERKGKIWLRPEEYEDYPIDYKYNPGDPTIYSSGGTTFNAGIGISFSSFSVDVRFSPAMGCKFDTISSIKLKETPDTIHFFITYNIYR